MPGVHNALTTDRKKPRPLKSKVPGGFAAENRGAGQHRDWAYHHKIAT
jgi:hypothetical protein